MHWIAPSEKDTDNAAPSSSRARATTQAPMPKTPTNTKPRTSSGCPTTPAGPTFRPTPFPPLPDVIVHHTAKNWLLLIEAVTSAGPVDGRLELGWKARTQAELALMADPHPLPAKRAQGRDISGLSAYEQ